MAFYFSRDLRKISRCGFDRYWFKYKRLYLTLEEAARSGKRSATMDDLAVQEVQFLIEEKFKVNKEPNDTGAFTYTISW